MSGRSGRLSPAGLAAVAALLAAACARPAARPPDVVLVVVDTLRADRLGAHGSSRGVTPALDALAARATVFENAIAQSPHTIPSVLQLMTSRYAQGLAIPAEDRTLAEVLSAHGYDTLAVVENPNFELHPDAHGLMRGFRRFYRNGLLGGERVVEQLYKTNTTADAVTAQVARALRGRDRGRPVFLWAHYFDPHDPYLPPFADDLERLSRGAGSAYTGDVRASDLYRLAAPPVLPAADQAHVEALYDAEVRHVDQALGDLFDVLRAEGLFDRALIVVTSDHGESLGEHGVWTHGRSAWDPEIRVPLLVRRPGQSRPARVRAAVELLDVFPTVLDVAGLPAEGLRLDGASLYRRPQRPAFLFWKEWQVVRTAEWKLVQAGGPPMLFRVDRDPGEGHDLFSAHADVAAALTEARAARLRGTGTTAGELDEVSRAAYERLRALGYLGR